MKKQKLVIANWKMNPQTAKDAKRIFVQTKHALPGIKGVQVVLCPPSIYVAELSKELVRSKLQLGVQDVFHEPAGAYTGQISVGMVKQYKAKYALLGHSERRALGETNALVGEKVRYVIRQGMTAVLCIGETERNDEGAHFTYVRDELEAVFAGLKRTELAHLVIAYEPVWAIGKSAADAMKHADLFEMVLYIKKLMIERFGRANAEQVMVLYGGSVKPENAASFIAEGGVDGLLVGSASLDPKQFTSILNAVATA